MRDNSLNQGFLDLLSSLGNLEASETNAIVNGDNEILRFFNSDVGFFDLYYDDKFNNMRAEMKHVEKKTYFYNVLIFINRIKNVVRIKDFKLLRNNFHIYLRDETLK